MLFYYYILLLVLLVMIEFTSQLNKCKKNIVENGEISRRKIVYVISFKTGYSVQVESQNLIELFSVDGY